jgi:hypothetical protein
MKADERLVKLKPVTGVEFSLLGMLLAINW